MTFLLPPDITSKKQRLDGCWVYTFRHASLGELGRIVLQGTPNGQSHIACEVAGEPDDPMTQSRLNILQPLAKQITDAMESILGSGSPEKFDLPPVRPKAPREVIESKLIPCNRCDANVAMLIFAYDAKEVRDFEDTARKMYRQYRDLNVAAWIIGEPLGKAGFETPSLIIKVWPDRGPIREMTPTAFNNELDELMNQHCQ